MPDLSVISPLIAKNEVKIDSWNRGAGDNGALRERARILTWCARFKQFYIGDRFRQVRNSRSYRFWGIYASRNRRSYKDAKNTAFATLVSAAARKLRDDATQKSRGHAEITMRESPIVARVGVSIDRISATSKCRNQASSVSLVAVFVRAASEIKRPQPSAGIQPAPLLSGILVRRRSEDSITVITPSHFISGGKSLFSCSADHSKMV